MRNKKKVDHQLHDMEAALQKVRDALNQTSASMNAVSAVSTTYASNHTFSIPSPPMPVEDDDLLELANQRTEATEDLYVAACEAWCHMHDQEGNPLEELHPSITRMFQAVLELDALRDDDIGGIAFAKHGLERLERDLST